VKSLYSILAHPGAELTPTDFIKTYGATPIAKLGAY